MLDSYWIIVGGGDIADIDAPTTTKFDYNVIDYKGNSANSTCFWIAIGVLVMV